MDKNDLFQHWLFDMSDTLEAFFKQYEEYSNSLDFSLESLEIVEGLILKQYSTVSEAKESKEAKKINQFAVYVGQTIRRNIGGKWKIELENPKFAYYGLPIITDYCEKPTPYCPLALVSAAIDRRNGKYIKDIIQRKHDKLNQCQSDLK